MSVTFIALPLPRSGKVRKIVHLSDLHIRTGDPSQCRFKEYETVFARTIEKVRVIADDETVVVLTGDIFHNKSKVEASGIVLFYSFITGLARLVPVYIIQGNHDYRQDQHDTPDLIGALLHERTVDNVCYMEKTGWYVAGDVGFGLVSVRETLVAGDTSGQVDTLPPFPSPTEFPATVTTKVALFHGTVNNCTLQNYTRSPTGYPIGWFHGYDIACLGDVHLQQVHTTPEGMSWGYPGSLVQQDFGEPIIDHGMLVWNIGQKTVAAKNIMNDYGFLKVKEVEKNTWQARYKNTWIPMESLLSKPLCPRVLAVRVVQTVGGAWNQFLRDMLIEHGKEATITYYLQTDDACDTNVIRSNEIKGNCGFDVSCYNSPLTWEQYIEEKGNADVLRTTDWKTWLRHPETLCISVKSDEVPTEELQTIITDRNNKLVKQIDAYVQATDVSNSVKATVSLTYLEWSWMLCFRETNWFNFETLKGEMASINARNGYGKSSFLEVLCLALYGHTIPSRYSKEHSVSVVCQQRPAKTNGKTVVQFAMNGVHYVLKRTYSPVAKYPSKLLINEVELTKKTDGGDYIMIHSGKSAVDAWIAKHLGTLESFLLSCMLTQNGDQDFFDLKPSEQLQLLDRSLNFNSINELSEIFKQAGLAHKSVAESLGSIHASLMKTHDTTFVSENMVECITRKYEDVLKTVSNVEEAHRTIPDTWTGTIEPNHMVMDTNKINEKIALYDKSDMSSIDMLNQRKGVVMNEMDALDMVEIDDDVKYTPQDLHDAEENVRHLERCRKDLIAEKPVVPAGGMEYATWRSSYERYITVVKDTYGSIDSLLERPEIKGNAPFKPSLDRSSLAKYHDSIHADKSKLRCASWFDYPEDIFGEKFCTLESRWREVSSSKEKRDVHYEGLLEETREAKGRWIAAETALAQHTMNPIIHPGKTEDECDDWLASFAHMKENISNVRNRHDALGTFLRLRRDIADINGAHHPFNEHCWACQKQSWKLKLTEKETALDDTVGTLRSLGLEEESEYTEDAFQEMRYTIESFTSMTCKVGFWEGSKAAWSAYGPYERTREVLESNVRASRVIWETKEAELEESRRVQSSIEREWDIVKKEYEEACYCKEHRPRWTETMTMIEQQEALWSNYESVMGIIEAVERTRVFLREHAEWRAWKAWKGRVLEMEREYESVCSTFNRVKYYACSHEIQELERRMSDLSQSIYWKKVADLKPKFDKKNELTARLEVVKAEYTEVSQEYHMMLARYEVQKRQVDECAAHKRLLETLEITRRAIDHVHGAFSGFRKWLYSAKVLPRLLQETNRIVSQVTHTDTLKLDVEVHQDGDKDTQKLAFSWFICDGFNRVPMEKASGFQRFIIGLGVRISLSYIGASFVRCQQLFIDEGFTACDKTHLLRVPEFIHNLLGMYETIVLVSHLDEIKDATRIQIPITRKDGASVIQYGAFLALDQKKKRGRKPKTGEAVNLQM